MLPAEEPPFEELPPPEELPPLEEPDEPSEVLLPLWRLPDLLPEAPEPADLLPRDPEKPDPEAADDPDPDPWLPLPLMPEPEPDGCDPEAPDAIEPLAGRLPLPA